MNIYVRFFNQDVLVHSVDEVLEFLDSIPEISVTKDLVKDVTEYVESDLPFPKRYKIRPRVYFILIKTNATTMEEFRANRKKGESGENAPVAKKKESKSSLLHEKQTGWYNASITFKRVTLIPGTTKFQYRDTDFEALIFADTPQECYNKLVGHLKDRKDVDPRSQYPSAKGDAYSFEYIGTKLPQDFKYTKSE